MPQFLNDLLGAYDRLIMDPVHGGISLYRHEVACIDHPLFQRLRFICQNDILSLVFPGATHSRFLHSIGVMHTGGRMFRTLFSAYLKGHASTASDQDLSPDNSGDVPLAYLPALDYFHKITRLACLLHDCGHSSFSHQFTKSRSIRNLLAAPGRFEKLWAGQDPQQIYGEFPRELEHEHYSIRCAWQILQDIELTEFGMAPMDVLGVMETSQIRPSQRFQQYAQDFWRFVTGSAQATPADSGKMVQKLLSLIVSGEIDADRADYMLRDGFHSSVTIGGFNLDHLLNNLRVGWDAQQPWLGLAISAKGLGALEDFVYSRHQMYRKVYGHKTSIGFDWLLREAIDEVLEDSESHNFVDACLADISEFGQLTDNYFWELFRRKARQHPASFSAHLIGRHKLTHLLTKENLSSTQTQATCEELAAHLGIAATEVVSCTLRARFSNIREHFNDIKVLTKDPFTKRRSLKQISEVSGFFSKFEDGNITHFYRRP